MKALLWCSLLLFVAGYDPAAAAAQLGVDDDGYVDGDYDHGDYTDEGGEEVVYRSGADSLGAARQERRSVVIRGTLRQRAVPDVYTVRRGDTLWDITGRFYGSPWEWPRVWSYNPEITNPHWIYPDDPLRLLPEGEASPALPESGFDVASSGGQPRFQDQSVLLRDQGYLDEDALRTSGVVVGSPEEQMLLSTYDELYLRFEEDAEVRTGMELTVFREVTGDERQVDEEGRLVRIYGTVRLRSYDPERRVGRAVITEALDPIERGFRVANIPRRFELVPAVANDRDLEGAVVATMRQHELVGDYQLVFIDLGADQGVQEGNRFFIVRRGDEWRDNLQGSESFAGAREPDGETLGEYPTEIVAEGRVVSVRPTSSTLMITRSTFEVQVGDQVELREGY